MIIKIAWRNIWRHMARSIVIMVAVSFGLWTAIFLIGYYNGVIQQRINSVISNEISHIQIHHKDFLRDYDLKYSLPAGKDILKRIRQHPSISAASGRMIVKGMIANASGSAGIQINGIDPEEELKVTNKKRLLVEGKYFPPERKNQILVGEKLAKKMKLKLKSKVVLSFQDKNGNIASAAFRICAIFRTNSTPYDESNVFVDLKDLNAINQSTDSITEIAILLPSNEKVQQVQNSLVAEYKNLEIKNWMEISPEMDLMVSSMNVTTYIFMGIILLGLAFGIVNTMLMAVLERTRELGMLISLGMNKSKVFLMVLLETLFLVLTASPVGIGLGFMTVAYFHSKGLDISRYAEALRSFGFDTMIYPSVKATDLLRIIVMIVITALLSSIFPARIALRLNPAEAIKK